MTTRARWWLMGALLCLSMLAAAGIFAWRTFLHQPLTASASDMVQVVAGSSAQQVTRQLARRWGQPELAWKVLYRLQSAGRPIQAGEYAIPAGATPVDVLELLLSGKVVQHAFRIQEGWNLRQLMAALEQDSRLKMDLEPAILQQLQAQLAPGKPSLEGLFFPDTYRFQRGSTASALLLRAGKMMREQLQAQWRQRDLKQTAVLETPYQALILASIIEKETGLAEEMPRIAGVFFNRLRKGMRLQTDPTVIYGLGEDFDGNLRRKDLKAPTPWNTYVIQGLPPTPIAMPSLNALRAVMHPEQHEYLYFVADGSGGHVFSKQYAAHRQAVRKYQIKGH